jgi:signal transduction histidine kinase
MLLNLRFSKDEDGNDIRRLSLTDITELKEVQDKLRLLTKQLLTFQELERKRIARDLHDELGQSLMALKMQFNAVKRSFRRSQEPWKEFGQAIGFIDGIAQQTRDICQSLRPSVLQGLGLDAALMELLAQFRKHHGVEVSEELDELSGLFSAEAQMAVYRIFQESLTNAFRHGQATRVQVCAQKGDGAVCFSIEDNGAGFDLTEVRSRDESSQGLGLASMAERVGLLQGSLEITSSPGQGTRIVFTLPPDKK